MESVMLAHVHDPYICLLVQLLELTHKDKNRKRNNEEIHDKIPCMCSCSIICIHHRTMPVYMFIVTVPFAVIAGLLDITFCM